jgi:site-specific DNA-methyltransferase (adenine-specific)
MTSQSAFVLRGRNPDILTCIANLSNDEVFTPPELTNQMLDTLAQAWAANNDGASIWADKTVTFLDPCTKSGVFLREITSRLTEGLKDAIPDLQNRVDHILTKQVFGIGITQITSLLARRSVYCSKYANGEHSIAESFTDEAGNIWFDRTEHTWEGNKCKYCGAPKTILDRHEGVENYAYPFIHTDNIKTWIAKKFGGDMQFDVVIGNPPYQLSSDGGTRDVPIYQKFVEQAKLLEPRFLSLVIPARWMASGLGLNEFREVMLNDRRIRDVIDYPVAKEVFPSVEIKGGVCFFLWDRDYQGDASVQSIRGGVVSGPTMRDLSEFDVLVRDNRAIQILRKVLARKDESIIHILSVDKEFGWTSNFEDFHAKKHKHDVPIHYGRHGKRLKGYVQRSQITKSEELVDKWKVMVPQAGSDGGQRIPDVVLGKPFIASKPSVCTQTFLFFYLNTRLEAQSVQSYLRTRFFRFLVSLRKITQDATRSTYTWVPQQTWDRTWTDKDLYKKYKLTKEEIEFIESMIRPMEVGDDKDD